MSDASLLRRLLAHPAARGLDLDDPATTAARRDIIGGKRFLRDVYGDWYAALAAQIPAGAGRVVELGSGAGFLGDYVAGLVTSEVFFCDFVRVVLDAGALPFPAGSLRAILMTNVLHHLPRPLDFIADAARAVRPGGVVAMIEPWITPWSRFVYRRLHHEPCDPAAPPRLAAGGGPLSGANSALPWILFVRDRPGFDAACPAWRIETIRPMMPLRYLLSGGVSMRALMPGWTTAAWRRLDRVLERDPDRWAMFALVVLRRTATPAGRDA